MDGGVASRRSVDLPWVIGSQLTSGEIKAECFSALISSGGIEVIGLGSTGVVDLILEFHISEFGKWRKL
jgi:hypothetical protein